MCQSHANLVSVSMYRAAIVSHSLEPLSVCVSDLPDVSIDLYRFPGATIDSLTNRLDQRDFWNKTYG